MKAAICTSYFVISISMFVVLNANAQKLEYGMRFMPTLTVFKVYTPSAGTTDAKPSFGYGVEQFFAYNFSKHFALQGEFLYSDLSLKYKEGDAERKIHLSYIHLPVLFSVNSNRYKTVNVNAVVGPQFAFKAESNILTLNGSKENNSNAVLAIKTLDLALVYGVGIDFGLNKSRQFRLSVGFRGTYGLTDISKSSAPLPTESYYILKRTHLQTYSAYVGVSFLFGKTIQKS